MFEVNKKAVFENSNIFCVMRPLRDKSKKYGKGNIKNKDHNKQVPCETVSV